MSELSIVRCDLCDGIVDGMYRHIEVDTDYEESSLEAPREAIVEHEPNRTVGGEPAVELVGPDERVSVDVCGDCLNQGVKAAYDGLVNTLKEARHE